MGHASGHAEGLLLQKTYHQVDMMSCQLVVHSSDGAPLVTKHATYGSGLLLHVEHQLLCLLKESFGDFSAIPAGAKIIFYGFWSPCKQCTNDYIPPALHQMGIFDRNLRVRFRFKEYYTQARWEAYGKGVRNESGGHFFWESEQNADAAYSLLAAPYGTFALKNLTTPTEVKSSVSPRVAFIKGDGRSRTVTTWHESFRGKIG